MRPTTLLTLVTCLTLVIPPGAAEPPDATPAYRRVLAQLTQVGAQELTVGDTRRRAEQWLGDMEQLDDPAPYDPEKRPRLRRAVAPLLAHYGPILSALDALPAGPARFLDARAVDMHVRMPHLNRMRELDRVLRLAARQAGHARQPALALRRIGQRLRLAADLERERILISRLVADSIRNLTCRQVIDLLRGRRLDPAAIEPVLAAASAQRLPFVAIFEGELLVQRNTFRRVDRELIGQLTHAPGRGAAPGPGAGPLDANQLRQHLSSATFRRELFIALDTHAQLLNRALLAGIERGDLRRLRRLDAAMKQRSAELAPELQKRMEQLKAELQQLGPTPWPAPLVQQLKQLILEGVSQGTVLMTMPVYAALLERSRGCDSHFNAARTVAALERHRATRGAYPEALSALDRWLPAAARRDRLDDRPLRYRRRADGYLLYSIGGDLRDDGGSDRESSDAPDVVFVGGTRS